MFRPWLVILALLAKHSQRDAVLVASAGHEICSAANHSPCSAKQTYPKLVRHDGVQVGHVQSINLTDGQVLHLITKSLRPLLFEIPKFLSAEECEHIIKLASNAGLFQSTTLPDIDDEKALTDQEKKEDCLQLFGSDENHNGKVSVWELGVFLNQTYGISLNNADIEMMLTTTNFDRDGDGEISLNECMEGDHVVLDRYMNNIVEEHPQQRTRLSQQTWLQMSGTSDSVLRDLQDRVIQITKLPRIFVERSEDLQVVQYGVHGHYHAHYDSTVKNDPSLPCCMGSKYSAKCSQCRFLTVLYYLNDVPRGGETAFPVADEEHFNETEFEEKDLSNLSTHCYDANVVIRPRRGTAIMWYNHMISNMSGLLGPQDEHSLHGGCDVLEGHKWIANNWINAPIEWKDHL